jgi:hypothetical protein
VRFYSNCPKLWMILITREGSGYVVCVRSETGFGSGLLRDKPWGTWHWWYLLGEMCRVPTQFELLSRILWCLGCDSWFCILIFNEVPQSLQTNVWPNSHSFNISPWCQNFFGWTSYPRKGTCADFEIVDELIGHWHVRFCNAFLLSRCPGYSLQRRLALWHLA